MMRKIKDDPKVRVNMWLLIQKWNYDLHHLQARGYPHDVTYTLFEIAHESATHMLLDCPFTKNVWDLFLDTNDRDTGVGANSTSIKSGGGKLGL